MTDEERRMFSNRLRERDSEIAQLNEQCDIFVRRINEHADEIERLREENKFLRSLVADELRALEPKP